MTDIRMRFADGDSFVCPNSMEHDTRSIFERGEYDIPIDFDGPPPCILDLGACCGAFSRWAIKRWPGAYVHAFEPNPVAWEYLQKNTVDFPQIMPHQLAVVGDDRPTVRLYDGTQNLGQTSVRALDEGEVNVTETFHDVEAICASHLPPADIVKADCEGVELEILSAYDTSATSVVVLEYHRREDRDALTRLMHDRGFTLWSGLIRAPWLGTLRFVREDGAANPFRRVA